MGQAVARKLNADHCDEQGSHLPCKCGAEARLAGRRPKTFTTALGPLTLERAWYHCERCHHGFSPRDRALGMEHTFVSPAALRMMGIAAARTSFAGASALLRELAGLTLAPKTVERHAEALGREVATDESRIIEPEPCDAPTVYLGLDGTGVPARKTEVESRCGKQPDGSAKTREAKLVVVWSAQTTDKDARPVRDAGSAIYGSASEIGERWARMRREELDEGRVDEVIAALRSHAGTCEEARKNAEYFSNNRERMNYPTFRAMGLCVATGVVEGGCKHIVGARLKHGGMRWTVAGANAIIALRCAVESNRFDDFWERRVSTRS